MNDIHLPEFVQKLVKIGLFMLLTSAKRINIINFTIICSNICIIGLFMKLTGADLKKYKKLILLGVTHLSPKRDVQSSSCIEAFKNKKI